VAEAAAQLARAGLAAAWVPPANLHVTVKFLGWTRDDVWHAVRDRLREVAAGVRPFELEASGAGAFPDVRQASVVWAGVRDPQGQLGRLAAEVDTRLAELGFAPEGRAFVPHVTLARCRTPQDVSGALGPLGGQSFGSSTVREICLYESRVKAGTSEYAALARARLGVPVGLPESTERQSGSVKMRAPDQEEPDHGSGDRPEGAREGD
jgi:2'-5' RNA ligase